MPRLRHGQIKLDVYGSYKAFHPAHHSSPCPVCALRRKGGHIYAPVPLPPIQQHHQQQYYPAPASDNQMDDAFANQSQEVPNAILEDARGNSVSLEKGVGHQQQQEQEHQQQPETFRDERSLDPSGVETEYQPM